MDEDSQFIKLYGIGVERKLQQKSTTPLETTRSIFSYHNYVFTKL